MKGIAILLILVGMEYSFGAPSGLKHAKGLSTLGPFTPQKTRHNVPYGPIAGAVMALGGVVLSAPEVLVFRRRASLWSNACLINF